MGDLYKERIQEYEDYRNKKGFDEEILIKDSSEVIIGDEVEGGDRDESGESRK